MAHYDLEEQEQIDALKTWWTMYGNLVTGLLTVVCLVVVGWQGWNWYQRQQSAEASAIFGVLDHAAAEGNVQQVKAAAGELVEKYGRTSYAPLAAMLAASQSFSAGDLKTSKIQLTWVMENGKDEIKDLARLHLVAVELDEKAYDEALKLLEAPHAPAFDARFLELKGDVLLAQNKKAEARVAYQAALDKDAPQSAGRGLLQQKLDSLGEAA